MADNPTSRRRWCQFRLRTLLLIVTAFCVPLSWMAWKMDEKRQERAAIAEIERLGIIGYDGYDQVERQERAFIAKKLRGTARFNWYGEITWDGLGYFSSKPIAEPTGPRWIRWLLGDDVFSRVVYVHLPHRRRYFHGRNTSPEVKDDDLRLLAIFSKLEVLDLSHAEIGDAGLAHLQGLDHLRALDLSSTNITNAGLPYLSSLTALKKLALNGTKTTKAAVDDLAKALPGCDITGP